MPRPLTEREREAFLSEPRVGVLSVASDDDRPPLTELIWYGYQPDGNLSFFTGTQSRKARKTRLIRNADVLSLSVKGPELPYKYVTVEGVVVETYRPPTAEQMLAIVRRYLPGEEARAFVEAELESPRPELALFTIRPDRWLTADYTDDVG